MKFALQYSNYCSLWGAVTNNYRIYNAWFEGFLRYCVCNAFDHKQLISDALVVCICCSKQNELFSYVLFVFERPITQGLLALHSPASRPALLPSLQTTITEKENTKTSKVAFHCTHDMRRKQKYTYICKSLVYSNFKVHFTLSLT